MNTNVNISCHRTKAFQYISEMYNKYNHFPIFEHYPYKSNEWIYTYPSPFLHANVLYSLLNCQSSASERLISDAGIFLWKFREIGDIWRFWNNQQSTNPVLCGTEDTAIASIVLQKLGYKPKNKKKILNRIREDGAIYTWIVADKKLFFSNPITFFWLLYNDRSSKETFQKKYMSLDDCEPTITATVIAYLGENKQTEKTITFLKSAWEYWEKPITGIYDYYESKIVFAFHISRAYKEGCEQLGEMSYQIEQYIEKECQTFEFAELLMAYLCLSYFQKCESSLLLMIKNKILSELRIREAYFDYYKYISSNDRKYFGGSNILTAAWFLEVTKDW